MQQEDEGEDHDLSWMDELTGAIVKNATKHSNDENKDIVNVLKLQLEEAQDHNQMIQVGQNTVELPHETYIYDHARKRVNGTYASILRPYP